MIKQLFILYILFIKEPTDFILKLKLLIRYKRVNFEISEYIKTPF